MAAGSYKTVVPINQMNDRPANKPTNQWTNQPTNLLTNQPPSWVTSVILFIMHFNTIAFQNCSTSSFPIYKHISDQTAC